MDQSIELLRRTLDQQFATLEEAEGDLACKGVVIDVSSIITAMNSLSSAMATVISAAHGLPASRG